MSKDVSAFGGLCLPVGLELVAILASEADGGGPGTDLTLYPDYGSDVSSDLSTLVLPACSLLI